jgi:CheY-like chemotaxis protein
MNNARILLVEDHPEFGIAVKLFLEEKEYLVEHLLCAEDATRTIKSRAFDLFIFDVDLPDGTGFDLCQQFRQTGGVTPVLMMTAKATIEDKETGMEVGADDYITKPFSMRELATRVKAVLRRANDYSKPAHPFDLQPGTMVSDRYKLLGRIGEGGMATIWHALDTTMCRQVVLKVLHPNLSAAEIQLARFEQESRLLAQISHQNIVSVYDAGALNGTLPYMVMEYIKGESLGDILFREGSLPLTKVLQILIQVCHGLEAAHEAGIVHRDLKPDNILIQDSLNKDDAVKIVDFGIARLMNSDQRLTKTEAVVGTTAYLSPEHLFDLPVDGRADVYALGIIMFELLIGEPPFVAETAEAVMLKHITDEPGLPSSRRFDLGSEVDRIVARALAKAPERRHSSAKGFRFELESLLALQKRPGNG